MEQRICKQCGKPFVYHGHLSGDHTKYCSDECADQARRESNLRTYYKSERIKQTKKLALKSDERRRQWLENNVPEGFEYLGDWTGGNAKASFKCLKHGVVVCRNIDSFRPHTTIRCQICRKESWAEQERKRNVFGSMEEWRAEQARRKEKRRQEELERRRRVVVCDVCEKKIITYHPQQKRCSPECTQSFRNRGKGKRLTKTNTVDRNITLPRLYKRDEGFCHICGLKCNWDDKDIRDDGAFMCGPTYPTIDHVYPLAKGGEHSWENVKLAHWACNLKKSDDVGDFVPDGAKVITSGRKLPKKTLQYDAEGQLIGVYSSTGEAAKITGFKSKQIQKCARGEIPTYRGYVWKYAEAA